MTIVVDSIVSLGKFPSFARQRDFRREVEAAQPPAGATGEGRILPEREMSQNATEGWERERACPAGAYLHR